MVRLCRSIVQLVLAAKQAEGYYLSNSLITICIIKYMLSIVVLGTGDAQANSLWGDMSQSVARERLLHVIRQSPGEDMRL
jgi:hypothetical protein